jgi:hypothetical protein
MKKKDQNRVSGYGYVGRWKDGSLGWCMPTHLYDANSRRYPNMPIPTPWNEGTLSQLCKITVEVVPGIRRRRIK